MRPPVGVFQTQKFQIAEEYWSAGTTTRNGKIQVNCGHKHATREEALGCLDAARQDYHNKRWPNRGATS